MMVKDKKSTVHSLHGTFYFIKYTYNIGKLVLLCFNPALFLYFYRYTPYM